MTAMERALARIDAEVRHAPHFIRKRMCRDALEAGYAHAAVRARYGGHFHCFADNGFDIHAAIIITERAFTRELKEHYRSQALWGSTKPKLPLMVLSELRLLLRLIRRRSAWAWPWIVQAVSLSAQPALTDPQVADGGGGARLTGLARPVLTPFEAGELDGRLVAYVRYGLGAGRSEYELLMALSVAGLTLGEAASYLEAGYATLPASGLPNPATRDLVLQDRAPATCWNRGRGLSNKLRVIDGGRS